MVQKKFGCENNFGSKKILVPKKCVIGKIKVPKNFWVRKNFGSKKIVGPKNLSEKNFESKIFAPPPLPYGIELSKVGWIGRGGFIPWL